MKQFFPGLIFEWENGKAYHLEISEGDVAPYILNAGSPKRIEMLTEYLEDASAYVPRRGLTWVKGIYKGIPVFAFTSGMGPPSMAITLAEVMYKICEGGGVGYIIRIGTSGAMQEYIKPYSLVVADSVVRDESTSSKVVFPEYPANMDPIIYLSLLKAAVDKGFKYGEDLFLGKIQSKDDLYFYEGFHNSPVGEGSRRRFEALMEMGVLASEMEASILPIYRDYFRERYRRMGRPVSLYVGAILTTLTAPMNMDKLTEVEGKMVETALESLCIIDKYRRGETTLDDILRMI